MIKTYCDRCGEEIDERCNYTIRVQAPEIRAWGDDYYDMKYYQLCRNCLKEVVKFITASKTDCSWK